MMKVGRIGMSDRCLRCDDTPTYKECSHCGEIFKVDSDYQSYRLPTRDIGGSRDFKGHWHRFWHYDLCEGCVAELGSMLREFVRE